VATRHLLYFTKTRVVLYRWVRGRLAAESSFPTSDEGAQAFAQFLGTLRRGLYYVLADLVEEDFHQDTIPFVRGADRRVLLERKLAQRYRDTNLSLALSLGIEKTQRRDERILLSSFTNAQQFKPWLTALRDRELAIGGVYSVALLATELASRLGLKKMPSLVVTLEEAGLRQSYVENERLRFSRLGPLDAASASDPQRVAEAFARETTRVHEYLRATRLVPAESVSLQVVLIAPPGQRDRIAAAAPGIPQLHVTVIDFLAAAKAIGLSHAPAGAGAEALFLHLLANHPPREQYARENLRGAFRLWQWRKWLVASAAAATAACLFFAGADLWQAYQLREAAAADREQARSAVDQYTRVTAKFPPMPTTTDSLRVTMQQYGTLLKLTRTPQAVLIDISEALAASPKIELEQLRWETERSPKGADKALEGTYEVVEINARVLAARASDYRNIMLAVNGFLDSLRKQKNLQVIKSELPFDIGSQRSLSGDVGIEQQSAEPRFKVTVARKVGA
jgi:hypothetical protein